MSSWAPSFSFLRLIYCGHDRTPTDEVEQYLRETLIEKFNVNLRSLKSCLLILFIVYYITKDSGNINVQNTNGKLNGADVLKNVRPNVATSRWTQKEAGILITIGPT